MEKIEINITKKHFAASPGYIFDDCPLALALKEMFPTSFILIGGKVLTIIHKLKDDKEALIYNISDNYSPTDVDRLIEYAKDPDAAEDERWGMYVILTFKTKQDNYFYHDPKEDHVKKEGQESKEDEKGEEESTSLPENLFL